MIRCPTCLKWFQSLGYARHRAMHYDQREKGIDGCFACGKPMTQNRHLVDTRDGQTVYVGRECYRHVVASKGAGYRPPKGGPKLYLMPAPEITGEKGKEA